MKKVNIPNQETLIYKKQLTLWTSSNLFKTASQQQTQTVNQMQTLCSGNHVVSNHCCNDLFSFQTWLVFKLSTASVNAWTVEARATCRSRAKTSSLTPVTPCLLSDVQRSQHCSRWKSQMYTRASVHNKIVVNVHNQAWTGCLKSIYLRSVVDDWSK